MITGINSISFTRLHDFYVKNLDVFLGLFLINPSVLDFVNDVQTLDGPSKDRMLIVQPWL